MKILIFILFLAVSCDSLPDHIFVVDSNSKFGVYDSRMNSFVSWTKCDSALIDKDSIVTWFVWSKSRMCFGQPEQFWGYSTIDSARMAAKAWSEYGY